MQLLQGLELVLRQAQEWEQYAARHVSLATYLEQVSALVLAWRKLELGLWPDALSTKEREAALQVQ
jgi:midasin